MIAQVYTTPDGSTFDTKAAAQDHLRRPKIEAVLKKLSDGNDDLVAWLIDNRDSVEAAFDVGTIRRVTKGEKKKLLAALEAVKEIYDAGENNTLKYIAENVENIYEGFRYPTQKRLTDEEKAVLDRKSVV